MTNIIKPNPHYIFKNLFSTLLNKLTIFSTTHIQNLKLHYSKINNNTIKNYVYNTKKKRKNSPPY